MYMPIHSNRSFSLNLLLEFKILSIPPSDGFFRIAVFRDMEIIRLSIIFSVDFTSNPYNVRPRLIKIIAFKFMKPSIDIVP